ncbi:MAG: DUF4783 domain-containing protein [Maribacter sp.]|nr:DUF4783 domain-containing protein [Maribacter sp.]
MKALMVISLLTSWLNGIDSSVVENISHALRSGDIAVLDDYYAPSVDVTILYYQGFLNKSAVSSKVEKFFSSHSIDRYEIIHEGKSKGSDSVYTIGTLFTNQGKYRVYMFITIRDGKDQIEEIKIEA